MRLAALFLVPLTLLTACAATPSEALRLGSDKLVAALEASDQDYRNLVDAAESEMRRLSELWLDLAAKADLAKELSAHNPDSPAAKFKNRLAEILADSSTGVDEKFVLINSTKDEYEAGVVAIALEKLEEYKDSQKRIDEQVSKFRAGALASPNNRELSSLYAQALTDYIRAIADKDEATSAFVDTMTKFLPDSVNETLNSLTGNEE